MQVQIKGTEKNLINYFGFDYKIFHKNELHHWCVVRSLVYYQDEDSQNEIMVKSAINIADLVINFLPG